LRIRSDRSLDLRIVDRQQQPQPKAARHLAVREMVNHFARSVHLLAPARGVQVLVLAPASASATTRYPSLY